MSNAFNNVDFLFFEYFKRELENFKVVKKNEDYMHFFILLEKCKSSILKKEFDVEFMYKILSFFYSLNGKIARKDIREEIEKIFFNDISENEAYKFYYSEILNQYSKNYIDDDIINIAESFIKHVPTRKSRAFFYQLLFDKINLENLDFEKVINKFYDPYFYIEYLKKNKNNTAQKSAQQKIKPFISDISVTYYRFFKNKKMNIRKNQLNKTEMILNFVSDNVFDLSTLDFHKLLYFRYKEGDNFFFREIIRVINKNKLKNKLCRGNKLRYVKNADLVTYRIASEYKKYIKEFLDIDIEIETTFENKIFFTDLDFDSRIYLINEYAEKYEFVFNEIVENKWYHKKDYNIYLTESDRVIIKEIFEMNYRV